MGVVGLTGKPSKGSNVMDSKDPGRLDVNGRDTSLGVPRSLTKGKPSGNTNKADARGKNDACIKK